MRAISLIFTGILTAACGSEDSAPSEAPKPALCKTLKDGTVERYVISLEETQTRSVLIDMGFVPCD